MPRGELTEPNRFELMSFKPYCLIFFISLLVSSSPPQTAACSIHRLLSTPCLLHSRLLPAPPSIPLTSLEQPHTQSLVAATRDPSRLVSQLRVFLRPCSLPPRSHFFLSLPTPQTTLLLSPWYYSATITFSPHSADSYFKGTTISHNAVREDKVIRLSAIRVSLSLSVSRPSVSLPLLLLLRRLLPSHILRIHSAMHCHFCGLSGGEVAIEEGAESRQILRHPHEHVRLLSLADLTAQE